MQIPFGGLAGEMRGPTGQRAEHGIHSVLVACSDRRLFAGGKDGMGQEKMLPAAFLSR